MQVETKRVEETEEMSNWSENSFEPNRFDPSLYDKAISRHARTSEMNK